MPLAAALLSATALTPAEASCTFSNKVETCTGQMAGAAVHTKNDVNTFILKDMNNPLDAADSSDSSKRTGPAIWLKDPGGITPEPGDWSDSNRNGQNGIGGASGSSLGATISLDNGHAVKGPTGIRLETYGWAGSNGHGADHTDKTANAGSGGAGGKGGGVTFSAQKADGQSKPAAIIAGSADPATVGLDLKSKGGAGGDGGVGHSKGGLRDATGGTGGTGGAGGVVSATLKDGHSLLYNGAGIAVLMTSVGGNGGTGGKAIVDGYDADSAYGGVGGLGGSGGAVTLSAASALNTINTTGGFGVVLGSGGGDGGNGGPSDGGHDYGGDGGSAGSGGAVSASLWTQISTAADGGAGIYLRSAGGFAGDSGQSGGGIKNHPGKPGDPGEGGAVSLTLTGSDTPSSGSAVTTTGEAADGILLQSIGGMGGNGGSASGLIAFGSKGGSGGSGGAVSAQIDQTTVSTSGDHSNAFIAQSIGGGGGKAGKAKGLVALGADAGSGGFGGAVSAKFSNSRLTTEGVHAAGVLLQSIGGGGGSAGSDGGLVAIGGEAGLGGNGGTVDLTGNGLSVETLADNSVGLMVTSVGAGGGNAYSEKGPFSFGGNGGGGGDGAAVSITGLKPATGSGGGLNVNTNGNYSDAIVLQSVGGGGGKAASTFVALDLIAPVLGAVAGDGGKGGAVTFAGSVADYILTSGKMARGVLAQSLGGGGGIGGNVATVNIGLKFNSNTGGSSGGAGQDGGQVNVTTGGAITTRGDSSTAVLAQSIGGGGGAAGNHVQAGAALEFNHDMGASGGSGGVGGAVSVSNSATLSTIGADADGILAQSIGGGGGHSSNVTDVNGGGNISQYAGNQGATGGAGGTAGAVTVTTSLVDGAPSKITTRGDHSIGILAQSVAGGGGKGGHTFTGTFGVSAGGVTLGQGGGSAGKSGAVKVDSHQTITTSGNLSSAIVAQSVAGGGGQSGATITGNVGLSLSYTHGGAGGAGGIAGDVTAFNSGALTTAGDGATAMLIQSIGGAGGNGGTTVSGALSPVAINIGVGANGGNGGQSGTANVTNQGAIATSGNYAAGILVNVLAGAGGNAGLLVNGTAGGGEFSGAVNVSVGGSGGRGGVSKDVSVYNYSSVTTGGYSSVGIGAQSIGGAGGTGGSVYSGTLEVASEASASVNVAVGGKGGDGGRSGAVSITNGGAVTTRGHYSDALLAQSIGGNGGSAGSSMTLRADAKMETSFDSSVSVGGKGGSGAVAGTVTINNGGSLQTTGGNSHGIYAQSVGGNGGKAGQGVAVIGNFAKSDEQGVKLAADVQLGGGGGSGNHAGSVTVTHTGSNTLQQAMITTTQDTSYGIFAQSVGGGGGDGGNAGAYSVAYTKGEAPIPEGENPEGQKNHEMSLGFTMGGHGGGGGDGKSVDVTANLYSSIQTSGTASYAIFAQSVGGSGGVGGNGEPDAGWFAKVYDDAEVYNDALELLEQGKDLVKHKKLHIDEFSVNVGGHAGAASDGGEVSVFSGGVLNTTGKSATAIFAQSVGGGGGSGGDGSQEMLTSLTLAGSSGGGGDGKSVTVQNQGFISTTGNGAMGIFAQSVGGGGGAAGDIEGNIINHIDNLWETLGAQAVKTADGGKGGDGGDVSITNSGTITTSGDGAHGIFAHSVGGGGGAEGELGQRQSESGRASIGSEGREGDAGQVSVTVQTGGKIITKGTGAHGIFAQSAAGSGDSASKGTKVTVAGTVSAEGAQGRAILAQTSTDWDKASDALGASPDFGVVVVSIAKSGLVETTSTSASETIGIMGGRTVLNNDGSIKVGNRIENAGILRSASLDSNVIATDKEASLIISNTGLISGSFALSGANRHLLSNEASGTLALGSSVDLGGHSATRFVNQGVISAAGTGAVGASTVKLGGTLSSSGTLQVDVLQNASDKSVTNDVLTLANSGSSTTGRAQFSGLILPTWNAGVTLRNGDKGSLPFVISTDIAADNISFAGSSFSTGAVAYSLRTSDDKKSYYADYTVDVTGAQNGVSLSPNARTFASYFENALSAIETAGLTGGAHDALKQLTANLVNTRNGDELEAFYGEHTTEKHLIGAVKAVAASQALHGLLQSCPGLDPDIGDEFYRQRDCIWAQAIGGRHFQDSNVGNVSFRESVVGMSGAVQKEVFDDTFIEVGGQYEAVDIRGSGFVQSGDRFSAGVAVKREVGNVTFSATVGGGFYGLKQTRNYSVGADRFTADADIDGRFLSAEGRVTAVFASGAVYAKPILALSVTRFWQDGFSERGNGPLNWNVSGVQETDVSASPAIELGRAFDVFGRPAVGFVRAGLTANLLGTEASASARLIGADLGLGSVSSRASSDRLRGQLAVGFDMDVSDNLSFSLLGQGGFSENSSDIGGHARLKLRF